MSIKSAYRSFLELTNGDAAAAAILAVGVYTNKSTDVLPRTVVQDRLLTAEEVAGLLSLSLKTIRRMDSDSSHDRDFPQSVRLRSPAGGRSLKRWRLSDIRRYGGLEAE